MTSRITRRRFIQVGAAAAGAAALGRTARADAPEAMGAPDAWNAGEVAHLLPAVNHERLLLKVSFRTPFRAAPRLRVDGLTVEARPSGTLGRFWRFDAAGLEPARTYELRIVDAAGAPVCDPWPLRTFPAPDAEPDRLRVLIYTCAGGNGTLALPDGTPFFLPLAPRQRLLDRALGFAPDVAVGVGDQVYWDQQTALTIRHPGIRAVAERTYETFGHFDRDLPVLGSPNEALLARVVDPQLAHLYGARFRSTPVYLTQDDHDYFENDVARDDLISFPPDPFMLRLARATQHLYYPEFLPDAARPLGLPGSAAGDRAAGLSESYGTLRYGRLLEMLLYDCRRFMTLKGPTGVFVAPDAERWLLARTAAEADARHCIHVPSTPPGWSAGKWGEWYPDLLQPDGTLGTARAHPYWQRGWFAQHQRLLAAVGGQQQRVPVFASGDLHAVAAGAIRRSAELDFGARPVHTVLSGPIGTADLGWASAFRGTPPLVPTALDVDESLAPLEQNGFTIIDVTPAALRFRQFAWDRHEPLERIDTMPPVHDFTLARTA